MRRWWREDRSRRLFVRPQAGYQVELYGQPHFCEPDFVVRLTNGVTVVLEIKGQSQGDTGAKHQAANRWVSAVNHWGRLGEWGFLVCREPQRLDEGIEKLIAARRNRLRKTAAHPGQGYGRK